MSDLNNNGKDDIAEIEDAAKAFIAEIGTDIRDDALRAFEWLKDEVAALEPQIRLDLKDAIRQAVMDATSGAGTTGSIVADTLTILARDGGEVVNKVKSDVLTALVGLTTATPGA
jgi:hypothetical protein